MHLFCHDTFANFKEGGRCSHLFSTLYEQMSNTELGWFWFSLFGVGERYGIKIKPQLPIDITIAIAFSG